MDERTEPAPPASTTDTVALALIAVVMALAQALDSAGRERFIDRLEAVVAEWARDAAEPHLRHASDRLLGPAVSMLRNQFPP